MVRKLGGSALCIVAFLLLCALPSRAGKVDFSPPQLFSGANLLTGVFEYYLKVTDLDFGGGAQPFPIRLLYTPAKKPGYNYLGEGWTIPFFDSSFIEYKEGTARVSLLCGKIMYFQRDKVAPEKWTAKGGWKGISLDETTIEIFRADGWRLQYSDGQIAKVTNDQGRHWSWTRKNGRVSRVTEEGGQICILSYTDSGLLKSIIFASQQFTFLYDGFIIKSISYPSLGQDTFKWGASSVGIIRKSGSRSKYMWNPTTGFLEADDSYTYRIIPSEDNRLKFYKFHGDDEVNYYHFDKKNGVQTTRSDGIEEVKYFHIISGPLKMKLEKTERRRLGEGELILVRQNFYDKLARLVAYRREDGSLVEIRRFERGRVEHWRKGVKIFSSSGVRPDGTILTEFNGGINLTTTIGEGGKLTSRIHIKEVPTYE